MTLTDPTMSAPGESRTTNQAFKVADLLLQSPQAAMKSTSTVPDQVLSIHESAMDPAVYVEFRIPSGDTDAAMFLRKSFEAKNISAEIEGIPVSSKEERQIRLATCFLRFAALQIHAGKLGGPNTTLDHLLAVILREYCTQFFKGSSNIHAATESLPSSLRQYVINVFYIVVTCLRQSHVSTKGPGSQMLPADLDFLAQPKPILLQASKDGKAPLFAIFRGQGGVSCLDELVDAVYTYSVFAKRFVGAMAKTLHDQALHPLAQEFYPLGLGIMRWIDHPESRPTQEYLIGAPVSLPIIGLTQLFHYFVLFKTLEISPKTLKEHFIGTTGHSQGIISAVVLASSDTEEEFLQNSCRALQLLSWIGLRSQQVFPIKSLKASILKEAFDMDSGIPSPLLSVANLSYDLLYKVVKEHNAFLPDDRQITISLFNGPRSFTCSGHPQSLHGLNVSLFKLKAKPGQDESRVPFNKRRHKLTSKFLPVTVPFHSDALQEAVSLIAEDIERFDLSFSAEKLSLPVLSADDGSDLRSSENLSLALVEQICSKPAHWDKASLFGNALYILDFGPGGSSGIASLTQRNLDGTGALVVLMGSLFESSSLLTKTHFFASEGNMPTSTNWKTEYSPRLIRSSFDGQLQLDTRFTRILGKPPLMIAGMTPTSVNAQFVAATINAGYHIELAGGGHYNEQSIRRTVNEIVSQVPAGESITLNILYLNPTQWGFQFPLVLRMKKEGVPFDGICVAAGVPSHDQAVEIVTALKDSGLRHVAFKPGSSEAIQQVVRIANSCPDFPVILQWTGGRAGGHHGFEDVHQPLLETYSSIRRHSNIILVFGSGIGDADGSLPYLTGDWSVPFGYPPMPVDGLLMGSRMLVAKEAKTSSGAKECIVKAAGVDDERQWVDSYQKVTGGVLTVKSELGEPIHKIATRGVLLWKELDETIFSLTPQERVVAVRKKKDYIIQRLNSDFQKPWFGQKCDGSIADIQEMTYKEVVDRLVQLMFIRFNSRGWIHASYRSIVFDFLLRIQERFSTSFEASYIQSPDELLNPDSKISSFFDKFSQASNQLLTSDDVLYFLTICQRRGQKPVPFIPLLDDRFETWFKKDSLWQAEDLDAVIDQDPQRVCILQGPVAAKYSRSKDEPVKVIMDSIIKDYVGYLFERYYHNQPKNVPDSEPCAEEPRLSQGQVPLGVGIKMTPSETIYSLPHGTQQLPQLQDWLLLLCGCSDNWIKSLLTSKTIFQGKFSVPNRFPHIFAPRPGQSIYIHSDSNRSPSLIEVREGETLFVRASFSKPIISVSLFAVGHNGPAELQLKFEYHPRQRISPIHEVLEGRNDCIKEFYYRLWIGELPIPVFNRDSKFVFNQHSVTHEHILAFCRSVGLPSDVYLDTETNQLSAPMDYAMVAGWKSIICALFSNCIDADILKLVHLSNSFRILDQSAHGLKEGDAVNSEAEILSVVNSEAGKTLKVKGVVYRDGNAVVEVVSSFLYRGKFSDFENTFEKVAHDPFIVTLQSATDVALLGSREWFCFSPNASNLSPGSTLVFKLRSYHEFADHLAFSKVVTSGTVSVQVSSKEFIDCGSVSYESVGITYGNPVLDYLSRHASDRNQECRFGSDGHSLISSDLVSATSFTAPSNNLDYARISGDFNPIHINPYFAAFAELPGMITHGMWTSAATKKWVTMFAEDNNPLSIQAYSVKFVDMVLPGDILETKLSHYGMEEGLKLIKVQTVKQDGTVVLDGIAKVQQPATAFVFTGQGSQSKGMGMDLYESSSIAKQIWDRADKHFLDNYGISIIDIVKNNPTECTVYFGNRIGAKIRCNYQALMVDTIDSDGTLIKKSLFPEITDDSESFTFVSPSGLLSATQFTQPALTLMEKAAFEDMKSKGLVPSSCVFAGHSLGEYSALASVADILSIETLVDVVFYRGLSMQTAVPRDGKGRSNYGMVAVNPMRVHRSMFCEKHLVALVNAISSEFKGLLEIVNYNVDGQQYVVAGDVISLEVLKEILNLVQSGAFDFATLTDSPLKVSSFISGIFEKVRGRCEPGTSFVSLERGFASIPLTGIDVPFHSRFLKSGVPAFRHYLSSRIKETQIDVDLLRNRYIPNVVAKPFDISRDYFDLVYKTTHSEALKLILDDWIDEANQSSFHQRKLCRVLLIELLAYQFASPVLWIETQDQLFTNLSILRVIEIGPSPVLSGMTEKTLKAKYVKQDTSNCYERSVLCYSRDHDHIYYDFPFSVPEEQPVASNMPVQVPKALPAAVFSPVDVSVSQTSAPSVSDAPISAVEILRAIVAHKLRRRCSEISLNQSIKDLVGGKSTMQNEIMGDLAKEFGSDVVPEKSEELSLQALAQFLQPVHNGTLGNFSTALVNKLLSSKLPAGFGLSSFKSLLASNYGLGLQRSEGVLLHAVTMEPANRFTSESDFKSWLATVVSSYCQINDVTISRSGPSEDQQSQQTVVVNSAELVERQMRLDALIRANLESHAQYLGLELREGFNLFEVERSRHQETVKQIDFWAQEHGADYADGIRSIFDRLKIRRYDSAWNWSLQDAYKSFYKILSGQTKSLEANDLSHFINRANERLHQHLLFRLRQLETMPSCSHDQAKSFAESFVKVIDAAHGAAPLYRKDSTFTCPSVTVSDNGNITYKEIPRPGITSISQYVEEMKQGSDLMRKRVPAGATPFIFLESCIGVDPSQWSFDLSMTKVYFDVLESMIDGISFRGKNVLVTGCGSGSIGADIVRALLAGGATVIATTSRPTPSVHKHFRDMYEQYGSSDSSLTVIPFNQGSKTDIDSLIDCIYDSKSRKGLELDLDFVIPFAAISENGRTLQKIDSRSELAHRMMLTNLYRLLGNVASHKQKINQRTRPALVILPLSPNHGAFGNDGLYSESKSGLQSLLNRWESEDWSDFLTVVGAIIGWTRGTAIMSENNLVAHGIESKGARTFSTSEMAFNLMALLHPSIVRLSQHAPILADISGGLKLMPNLKTTLFEIRSSLTDSASICKAVLHENDIQAKIAKGPAFLDQTKPQSITPRANLLFEFPSLPTASELSSIDYMKDMLDLDRVIVATGFGEVGPYGNSRTRWEMEAFGTFSLEGCIELAWIMGYIKFVADRRNKDGTVFSGWVDAATGEPVRDCDIKRQYEERILKHTGIRMIEPELFEGWQPERKMLLQEVVFSHDMPVFECGKAEAESFLMQHGDFVDIIPIEGSSQFNVRLKKGATLYVPKALQFDRLVAGQIPTGWNAERYGVPKDIVDQVDPVTLYVLVATVDALVSSGITDPYEFFKYVHISSVGNTCGGGIGGMHALRGLFRDRFLDKPVQKDVLQESFINTMPAWINLLLLSSAGPIKSPVGACATAVQSVEIGVDTLLSGKAKIVICGGYDDFAEESSQEFANIGATSNSVKELAQGRDPREMSRPATESRGGFMESQGAGVHVLMTAKVAIEMGVPIYGIIAHTATAMDKVGRSVPAPGQGILTTARESTASRRSRLLDFKFRAIRLRMTRSQIKERADSELQAILEEAEALPESDRQQFIQEESSFIMEQSERHLKSALATWSHDFAKEDPHISPLRAALAVYGLTIDDVDVASFHGTGTKANDINESEVLDKQLKHLGRSSGNIIPSIFQKYLTGHPKGAAAAWMLNGVLNVINTGLIPGNRNADNIEPKLENMEYIFYPSRSIQTHGVKAGLLKSFGFGQVGGECLVIHPKYLYAALEPSQLEAYKSKRDARQKRIYRYMHDSLIGSMNYVQLKDTPPYTPVQESAVYLDPLARSEYDRAKQTWNFSKYRSGLHDSPPCLENMFKNIIEGSSNSAHLQSGIGCDNEWLDTFPALDSEFISRNFTPNEIAYCQKRPDPKASFAGRWCAKEAVLKSISDFASKRQQVWNRGAAAPLIEIEILPSSSGAPEVVLHGDAKQTADSVGVRSINVSISHSSVLAQAAAVSL